MDIAQPPDPFQPPKKAALQKLQEELDRQMKPFREIEMMYDQLRPHRHLHNMYAQIAGYSAKQQLQDLLRPFGSERLISDMLATESATKQMQRWMDSYFPKTAAIGAFGPGTDLFQEALEVGGAKGLAAKIVEESLAGAKVSSHERLLEQMQRQALGGLTMEEFTRHLERANPALSAIEAARKSIDSIFGTLRDVDFSAYDAPGDEDLRQAEEQVENISKAAGEEANFQAAAEQIATAVAAVPNPFVRLFLWVHFRTLLNHIYSGVVSTAISVAVTTCMTSSDASKSPQATTKAVKEAARSVVTVPEMLADQRYISAKVVSVRMNPRAKSPELGKLKFGNVVRLVRKEKDFSLVVWADKESGAEIQGWVYSRYLAKFN